MSFDYTSGNPDNLVGGNAASMGDIQGPFYDIRAYLNSGALQTLAEGLLIVGEVRFIALTITPAKWLPCYGAAVSRTVYAKLFTALSTVFGAGDGSTTFNVPDLRGRTTVGTGTAAGGGIEASPPNRTIGTKWGVNAVVLGIGEIPSHNHGGSTNNASSPQPLLQNTADSSAVSGVGPYGGEAPKTSFVHAHVINAQGGGGAHENSMPALGVPAYIYAGA